MSETSSTVSSLEVSYHDSHDMTLDGLLLFCNFVLEEFRKYLKMKGQILCYYPHNFKACSKPHKIISCTIALLEDSRDDLHKYYGSTLINLYKKYGWLEKSLQILIKYLSKKFEQTLDEKKRVFLTSDDIWIQKKLSKKKKRIPDFSKCINKPFCSD